MRIAPSCSCGPTVYDYAHIGNFRSFLMNDLIKRWLLYCGYDVDHVCNLTDVDDKILRRMEAENASLPELTHKYIEAFHEDLQVPPTAAHLFFIFLFLFFSPYFLFFWRAAHRLACSR